MVKLFFSLMTGYAIFIGLMLLQVITPLINSIDSQLGGGTLRVVVPSGTPLPSAISAFIDDHPQLVLRCCEGGVMVLLCWSALLLLTHWGRQLRWAWQNRHDRRVLATSRHLAAMAARRSDHWG